ncbi:DUF2577 domain-containing protein [Priestia megaterium]|uniref:DUF2577 domain-containing protein n=1 Tax=Priestia megaterium TaxID=1404 RepID=UPI001D9D0B3D|nr:DUF2577 domain-containing protein [Priestia megaterium]CAH0305218.1 hypothetical protein SRABI82_04702 [Priestia megaterium]
MTKPQGSGHAQLVQLMRKYGHNKDIDIELGTVMAPPPEVLIRLDSFGFDLDKSDLVFASRITESPLQQGDRVIVASNDAQTLYYVLDKAVRY